MNALGGSPKVHRRDISAPVAVGRVSHGAVSEPRQFAVDVVARSQQAKVTIDQEKLGTLHEALGSNPYHIPAVTTPGPEASFSPPLSSHIIDRRRWGMVFESPVAGMDVEESSDDVFAMEESRALVPSGSDVAVPESFVTRPTPSTERGYGEGEGERPGGSQVEGFHVEAPEPARRRTLSDNSVADAGTEPRELMQAIDGLPALAFVCKSYLCRQIDARQLRSPIFEERVRNELLRLAACHQQSTAHARSIFRQGGGIVLTLVFVNGPPVWNAFGFRQPIARPLSPLSVTEVVQGEDDETSAVVGRARSPMPPRQHRKVPYAARIPVRPTVC